MIRQIVNKPFNADGSAVDVVVETHPNGAAVQYPLPIPRLALSIDKTQIIADGIDEATVTVTFEACALVANELVWSSVVPTGDVTFSVNLRPTVVSVDGNGEAVLAVSKTIPGTYRIVASFPGYSDVHTAIDALV